MIAGYGGGYDCFTGLHLYFHLKSQYPNVYNSNERYYFSEFELSKELNEPVYVFSKEEERKTINNMRTIVEQYVKDRTWLQIYCREKTTNSIRRIICLSLKRRNLEK